MKNIPYECFSNFVLRAPLYSFDFFQKITSLQSDSSKYLKSLFDEAMIKEAIFLASPPLYEELLKWINHEIKDGKKEEKLKYSFLKYLSRMSSRCTPFGLFAGCSVGEFGNKTKLELENSENHSRHTRLDMNFLIALSQDLAQNPNIKKQLHFFPNNSIYNVGNKLRYVEYEYINSKRFHRIVAVERTPYITKILQAARTGLSFKNLAELLVDDEITIQEAKTFIDELIDNQLLISELEPSVSGPEFLEQILQVLSKLNKVEVIFEKLKEVDHELKKLDLNMGNPIMSYKTICEKLEGLHTEFDIKYLFQTDLILNTIENQLDSTVVENVKKGMVLFNKISLPPKDTFFNQFKEAFSERFEKREVSISKALDIEMGVGYKQNRSSTEINPLIDDITVPFKKEDSTKEIKWSSVDSIIQKKLFNAIANKDYIIKITDEDFEDFEADWNDLPETMNAMIEVLEINDDGNQKIKCVSIGGSSAANLFGRFCHGDENLYEYTQKIIDFESSTQKDRLLAEIVHLPESRVGNILMRPKFREYEIPYLAKSLLNIDKQLPIEDLYISMKDNKRVRLRSKKHNKEVIPKLTNAHNFSSNALPIYQFLCDMQTQGKRQSIGINLGPFINQYEFIPRIEYSNLIISEAIWNINKSDIEPLQKLKENDEELITQMKIFRKNKRIPKLAMLSDGDNELLINFENLTSFKMLLDTVKNRPQFKLTEFLHTNSGVLKNNNGKKSFTNQIILSFYKNEIN
jgi:hypothetical protein